MNDVLTVGTLFCAGLLAGEEVVIRFGIRAPLAALEQRSHIVLRQALIRTLRLLVPAIFLPTLLLGAAATLLGSTGPGLALRGAAMVALLVWLLTTLAGTVPINQAALAWDPASPPSEWRTLVRRWELLDTVRTAAATSAFALFLLATTTAA
jgi:uncharacterized membrane protein